MIAAHYRLSFQLQDLVKKILWVLEEEKLSLVFITGNIFPLQINHQSDDVGLMTALQVASHEGHFDSVKLLVEAKADLELEDKDGDRALAFSVIG